jgi:hypothetical protein
MAKTGTRDSLPIKENSYNLPQRNNHSPMHADAQNKTAGLNKDGKTDLKGFPKNFNVSLSGILMDKPNLGLNSGDLVYKSTIRPVGTINQIRNDAFDEYSPINTKFPNGWQDSTPNKAQLGAYDRNGWGEKTPGKTVIFSDQKT